jgi:hypothetical protein
MIICPILSRVPLYVCGPRKTEEKKRKKCKIEYKKLNVKKNNDDDKYNEELDFFCLIWSCFYTVTGVYDFSMGILRP